MKTIKNVLLASSMVILSANVLAVDGNYGVRHASKTIDTQVVESKGSAYSLAFEKLNQLKSESGRELNYEFAVSLGSWQEKNSVTLDDGAYITVQESMNEQGNVVYNGQVHVTYHYSQAN